MASMLPLLIIGALTGVVAIVLGGVLGFKVLPEVIDEKLRDNVRLDLSETFRNWENPPYVVTTKIHFFNVKNYEAVQRGANASLEEIGPIIYKQIRQKDNIVYDASSDTFKYNEWVSHEFDPSSTVKPTQTVTTLNVLKYMSLFYVDEAHLMDEVKNSFNKVFPDTTKNADLFHKIKIENLLFNGYESCLVEDTSSDIGAIILRNTITAKLTGNARFKKSETSSGFNFFVYKPEPKYIENNYEMYGGEKDISKQGQLKSINSKTSLNVWPDIPNEYCNEIRGTDSFTFNPHFDVDNGITVYNDDLCRSLDYAFTEEIEVRDLPSQRLILKSENFQYPEKDNVNKCFCIEENHKCISDGFLNLKNCIPGLPLIASQPHFLYTKPEHSERVKFKPSVEEDVSYIEIQSESGAVMRTSKKIQYNIWLTNVGDFGKDIKPFMLPLFWIEESMEITDHAVEVLNKIYFDDLIMIEAVKWGLLAIGAVLLLLSVGIFVFSKLKLNTKS